MNPDGSAEGPPWWVSDILIAGLVALSTGLIIFAVQVRDENARTRSQNEFAQTQAANQDEFSRTLAENAQRAENLRFVRERSSVDSAEPDVRPFRGIDLAGQNLSGLDMPGARLEGANLASANLEYADLTGADLDSVNLTKTDAALTIFQGADFERATLKDTDLRLANLVNASFTQAILINANFSGAVFGSAPVDMREAVLVGPVLADATIDAVDLSGANLILSSIGNGYPPRICHDETTQWPPGFTPPPSDPSACA